MRNAALALALFACLPSAAVAQVRFDPKAATRFVRRAVAAVEGARVIDASTHTPLPAAAGPSSTPSHEGDSIVARFRMTADNSGGFTTTALGMEVPYRRVSVSVNVAVRVTVEVRLEDVRAEKDPHSPEDSVRLYLPAPRVRAERVVGESTYRIEYGALRSHYLDGGTAEATRDTLADAAVEKARRDFERDHLEDLKGRLRKDVSALLKKKYKGKRVIIKWQK
jgi:hypothetical protein